ncbi:MAG: hypothetical protein WAO58_01970 [Fimbriimonadaceae bacterium]
MVVPLLVLSGFLGCSAGDDGRASRQGQRIESAKDLDPGALPGTKARLMLRDIPIPVSLVREQRGDRVELSLNNESGPIEIEVYRLTSAEFAFAGLRLGGTVSTGEFYVPPMPILKFPMTVGDTWSWTGRYVSGDVSHDGSAKVTTSGKGDSVQVKVDLELKSGGPKAAMRSLIFWIAPGRGVFKREFGESGTRAPAGG